jgi:LuxR family transcriptional regulator, maltose regulon positive regulatory protein
MNTLMSLENQLLATKFFVPVTAGTLIARPRLSALLQQSLEQSLTLISAPAGFGKTTLLSVWIQSLPAKHPHVAWVSLDEEDNEPRLFWTYVLTALNKQSQRFTPLLLQLQSQQSSPLKYILATLINLLIEGTEQFLLILDDYHLIREQQIHTTLSYLVEHLPPQLHIILSTREDHHLPLARLHAGYLAQCSRSKSESFVQRADA